jgi:chromosome segregation ATPase
MTCPGCGRSDGEHPDYCPDKPATDAPEAVDEHAAKRALRLELERCRGQLPQIEARLKRAQREIETETRTQAIWQKRISELSDALVILEKRKS